MYDLTNTDSGRVQSTTQPITQSSLGSLKVHLLPKWIFDSITRHNNLVDIQSYQKLRDCLSLTDMAHLEIVRQRVLPKVFAGTTVYLFVDPLYGVNALGETEQAEHMASVDYLVSMVSEQESVLNRLEGIEEEEVQQEGYETKPYSVTADGSNVYIVIDEGFIPHMSHSANRFSFLTQVLKSAYGVAPVSEVNGCCFYRLYLDALMSRH